MTIATITGICGNIGQWQPFTAKEAEKRYGFLENYLHEYAQSINRLIAGGYLLPSQKKPMLEEAARQYRRLN